MEAEADRRTGIGGSTGAVAGVPRRHLIHRPRLDRLLLGRFEHRVTTVVAPAGSGKTSAIALAVENNRLDPRGLDVYVPLGAADDSAAGLRARILEGLDMSAEHPEPDVRPLVDAVWSHAPDEVAIVLDDVHLMEDPEALGLIGDLIARLPENGHLVLSSRRPPNLSLARLRAHRTLLELDHDTLGFDDEELAELRRARSGPDDAELPRHAATADLRLAAGATASADFLREEVLSGLGADRLFQLRQASVLDDLDDDLVVAISDGRFDTASLLTGLPLVEWRSDGTIRLHSLLRDALQTDWDPTEYRKACSVAGGILTDRQQYAAAIRAYLEAADEIAVRDVARTFVTTPTMNQPPRLLREIASLVERVDDDGPLVEYLRGARRFNGLVPQSIGPMREIAQSARDGGDRELEALALHRAFQAQMFDLDLDDVEGPHLERLESLAETVPLARGALAHLRSQLAQASGDAAAAIAALDDYDGLGEQNRLVTVSQRLCDLGRVDEVGEGLTPEDLAGLPEGTEVFIAYAMWLRGEESPEFAHEFVTALLVDVDRRGVADTIISTLGVATSIALAAGDVEEARRRADWASDLLDERAPRTVELFAVVAQASVAAVTEGDAAAGVILDSAPGAMTVDAWPKRAHLLALPLVYVACPDARATLDRIELGTSLTMAVRAGRAVVALRAGDSGPARELPWSQRHLLRAHVLPHHLTELACAAAGAGSELAHDILADVPDLDRYLARLAGDRSTAAGGFAAGLLGRRPRVAPSQLHVAALGPMELRRDGVIVDDDDWNRRARVRELLALLCDRRRIGRGDALAELWPGHDDDAKADANLRSTLSRLQRVLEPERAAADDPYFLRTDGDLLTLHADVTTDVDRFERELRHAREADAAGSPARALAMYVDALECYRGDYALGLDAGWVVLPRMRLRSLATGAMCRVGELEAARGEPEEAARWAQRAQREDPLSERAALVFVSALAASGDRAAAGAAVTSIEQRFGDAGVSWSESATRVFDRWR